jgi:hypothetical protein
MRITNSVLKALISISLPVLGAASCGLAPGGNGPGATTQLSGAIGSCTGDWMVVDSPNVGGQDNSFASVSGSSATDVWAVGQFAPDANPNITLTLAQHWDGTAWSVVATPNLGTNRANSLLAVAAQPGAAWAVGYDIGQDDFISHSLIEAWDGSAWSIVDHPQLFETQNLYGVAAVSPDDVWAVGSGRNDDGEFHAIALHFDGHAWTSVPAANPGTNGNVLYSVVANGPNDVWAVGQKIGSAPPDNALVEHWNGVRWSAVSTPGAGAASSQLIAADVVEGDDLRAVGDAQDGVVSLRTFALSGEGAHFAVQGTPDPNKGDNRLMGVAAVGDDESWAVGSTLDDASGNLLTLIATGGEDKSWTQVASPSPAADGDSQLASVTKVGASDLWAVGGFDGPDALQTLIVHRCK